MSQPPVSMARLARGRLVSALTLAILVLLTVIGATFASAGTDPHSDTTPSIFLVAEGADAANSAASPILAEDSLDPLLACCLIALTILAATMLRLLLRRSGPLMAATSPRELRDRRLASIVLERPRSGGSILRV